VANSGNLPKGLRMDDFSNAPFNDQWPLSVVDSRPCRSRPDERFQQCAIH
jgi:hypothetical protein